MDFADRDVSLGIFIVAITIVISVLVLSYAHSIAERFMVEEDVTPEMRQHLVEIYDEDAVFTEFEYEGNMFYVVREGGSVVGMAHVGVGAGYGGDMEVLVGMDDAADIMGLTVVDHSETPDLGDRVMEDDFKENFVGLGYNDPIEIEEDIGGLTGATVSAEAMAEAARIAVDRTFDALRSGEY